MRSARLAPDDRRDRRFRQRGISIGFHARAGFEMIGAHPPVGLKFGRWLDTVTTPLATGDGNATIPVDRAAAGNPG